MERAAATHLARHPHAARHQLDEPQGDGETQTGAAEAARGRTIRLRERLKDLGLLVPRDADPRVRHRKV